MNKKKFKLVIIILALILVILLITFGILIYQKKHTEYNVMGKDFSEIVHSLAVSNLSELESFLGSEKNGISVAKQYVEFFTTEIPKINDAIKNNENMSEYYTNSVTTFSNYYFQIDEENFLKLCNQIELMEEGFSSQYTTCEFSLDEIDDALIITCYYENDEKIQLKMFSNKSIEI